MPAAARVTGKLGYAASDSLVLAIRAAAIAKSAVAIVASLSRIAHTIASLILAVPATAITRFSVSIDALFKNIFLVITAILELACHRAAITVKEISIITFLTGYAVDEPIATDLKGVVGVACQGSIQGWLTLLPLLNSVVENHDRPEGEGFIRLVGVHPGVGEAIVAASGVEPPV